MMQKKYWITTTNMVYMAVLNIIRKYNDVG